MLDDPASATVRTRWLVTLFFPLRSRYSSETPIPHEAIVSYLQMKGYEVRDLYDWFLVADSAVSEWVGEKNKKERDNLERSADARHKIRH